MVGVVVLFQPNFHLNLHQIKLINCWRHKAMDKSSILDEAVVDTEHEKTFNICSNC